MRKILNILCIHREERWVALVATLVFGILNAVTVVNYFDRFSVISDNYHKLFVNVFRLSGFDPLTYEVISNWDTSYNVYRHPLLPFFLWPVSMLNKGLMWLTGMNFATTLTGLIVTACATYSCLFLFRILYNVMQLRMREAVALVVMYFSFAFVMLSCMVPDHFVMSQFALLMTLWLAGEKLRRWSALNMWQTICLFIFTAGISLNNGLKIFLAALVTRRLRFFRWKYLLFAVVIPSALIWGFARWEYKTFVWPKEMARYEVKAKRQKAAKAKLIKEITDSLKATDPSLAKGRGEVDSAKVMAIYKKENQRRAVAKYREDHKKIWNKNTGKPIAKGEFMRWTDKTTSRWDVGVECLFGEALQFHKDYLLGDVLRNRPLIVKYRHAANYVVEGCIVLMFLIGVWFGRRSLLLWTAMSMFGMDMVLHMGLGFGINEIYIMTAHYMFVVPIAMAQTLTTRPIPRKGSRKDMGRRLYVTLIYAVAAWCLVWNVSALVEFFAR